MYIFLDFWYANVSLEQPQLSADEENAVQEVPLMGSDTWQMCVTSVLSAVAMTR